MTTYIIKHSGDLITKLKYWKTSSRGYPTVKGTIEKYLEKYPSTTLKVEVWYNHQLACLRLIDSYHRW
ncbi:hypothetical protein [Photobacterium marinum]|uniref:hypothetical protein n=1 Tax=Photobacterium marinum TaxID=1056511 RepID=UPI00056B22A1|nr:hypothetical protein [Photobacterium marinum]